MKLRPKFQEIISKAEADENRKNRKLFVSNNRRVSETGKVYILIKGGKKDGRL